MGYDFMVLVIYKTLLREGRKRGRDKRERDVHIPPAVIVVPVLPLP